MAREFLGFSCLVFLISIVYFIYTRHQLQPESKNRQNQQKVTAELEAPVTGHIISASRSAQPKTENSNPEPTEEEWAAFVAFLSNLEELEESEGTTETTQPEEVAETEVYGADGGDRGISPELEEMFIYYKKYMDRYRVYDQEIAPYMRRIVEIDERMDELFDSIMEKSNRGEEHQELLDARMQLYEERVEVSEALEPLGERMAQLQEELNEYLLTNHGIDSTTFNETYNEALRAWFANQ